MRIMKSALLNFQEPCNFNCFVRLRYTTNFLLNLCSRFKSKSSDTMNVFELVELQTRYQYFISLASSREESTVFSPGILRRDLDGQNLAELEAVFIS